MGQTTPEAPANPRLWERLESQPSRGQALPLRVLFATDGSEAAGAAASLLALLPLAAGSTIHVVTVLDAHPWQIPESLKGAELEWARRIAQEAEARLTRPGVQCTHASPRGAPAFEILQAAATFQADLVVVGSYGPAGLKQLLLGSVAEHVAKHAPCPVLVGRAPSHALSRAVLAVDSSEFAARAARLTAHFPLPAETQVTVCHVVRPYYPLVGPEYVPDLDKIITDVRKEQQADAQRLVTAWAERLAQCGKRVDTVVREGDPATEILELLNEQEADLVVCGARGISAIQALLVGSVADRLLRNARCSVLLVR